jgi:hypothetical protein
MFKKRTRPASVREKPEESTEAIEETGASEQTAEEDDTTYVHGFDVFPVGCWTHAPAVLGLSY